MQLRENVSLGPYTTLGIGGPARWFMTAESESDILESVAFARDRSIRLLVLGGGSNVLIADEGFDGLVLHIGLRGIRESGDALEVAAGEEWDPLVAYSVRRNLAGLECLSGIPGRAGATPVQNVGAYGQDVSQTITGIRAYHRDSAGFVNLSNADCRFGYRASIFNTSARDCYIVTSIRFLLTRGGAPNLSYPDLQHRFSDRSEMPTLTEVREAVRAIRYAKGMLIVEGDANSRSAGSFFRNPIVSSAAHHALSERYGIVPCYAIDDEHRKVPAAWLVEHAGFEKGYVLGRAAVSSKHTLALINRDNARARDIIALRDQIMEAVEQKFAIRLEPEPVYVS